MEGIYNSNGFRHYLPTDALRAVNSGKAILVDIREETYTAYKRFDAADVCQMPATSLNQEYQSLPKDKILILADITGIIVHEHLVFLQSMGLDNIAGLGGGIIEWERDGLPLIINNNERLDGSCTCQLRPRLKKD